MGREPSWSGQLPLLPHLFESLLALSGLSNKLAHMLTQVASDLVTWFCCRAPFMA